MAHADWWERLQEIDAVYECPKDAHGTRLGPLVTYAGKDELGRHYVGDIYADLALMERQPRFIYSAANELLCQEWQVRRVDAICGAPEGGKSLAFMLAHIAEVAYCYPDQELIAGTREKRLVFQRHKDILLGKRVVIAEDVMNNFSTTKTLIELIEAEGGEVVRIVGILNRSLMIEGEFAGVPVGALIRKQLPQYRQDDPIVVDDVRKGNVVLSPKKEWSQLRAVMQKYKQPAH